MGRNNRQSHVKSDAYAFGGVVDSYHIRPMTNKKQAELRDSQDLSKGFGKKFHSASQKIAAIRRAKRIESQVNMQRQAENKGPDLWHVLVESKTGKKIKMAAMSRLESFERNRNIRDLGMEWTLGEM